MPVRKSMLVCPLPSEFIPVKLADTELPGLRDAVI
jgi:hypothetical protein